MNAASIFELLRGFVVFRRGSGGVVPGARSGNSGEMVVIIRCTSENVLQRIGKESVENMTSKGLLFTLFLLVLVGLAPMAVQSATKDEAVETRDIASPESSIERGKYLVHSVAQCVQCHSPRDEAGKLIESRLLTGGRIPLDSPYSNEAWATQAPNIRGFNGYSDELAKRLLMEGLTRDGRPPMNPMPPFRMNEEDAAAVVAYLKSLP